MAFLGQDKYFTSLVGMRQVFFIIINLLHLTKWLEMHSPSPSHLSFFSNLIAKHARVSSNSTRKGIPCSSILQSKLIVSKLDVRIHSSKYLFFFLQKIWAYGDSA